MPHTIKLLGKVGGVVVGHTTDKIDDRHKGEIFIVVRFIADIRVKIIFAN